MGIWWGGRKEWQQPPLPFVLLANLTGAKKFPGIQSLTFLKALVILCFVKMGEF